MSGTKQSPDIDAVGAAKDGEALAYSNLSKSGRGKHVTSGYRLPTVLVGLLGLDNTDSDLSPDAVALLIAAWIYAARLGLPTQPLLVFTGPPGSGKTSIARALVRLLSGPNANVIVRPKEPADFYAVVGNRDFVAIDNVESSGYLPDALAAAATGAEFAGRAYYKRAEEEGLQLKAAIILTSMDVPFNRADVMDRCIVIPLRRFSRFRPEQDIQASTERIRAEFAAALDADLALVRQRLAEETGFSSDLRMADFYRVGKVVWGDRYEAISAAVQDAQAGATIRDDPVIEALLELVGPAESLRGKAGEIRQRVNSRRPWWEAPEIRNAKAFGDHLRRIADKAKAVGLDISWLEDRRMHTYTYTIRSLSDPRGKEAA